MNIVIIAMGGSGQRFGADIPKQFIQLNGKPIFLSIVEHYADLDFIDRICLVTHPAWLEQVKEWTYVCSKRKTLDYVIGGKTRSHSIKNALDGLQGELDLNDVILIHDATHPYLDAPALPHLLQETIACGAATFATFGYDTVYSIDNANFVSSILPRTRVINGASPEAFLFSTIQDIYKDKNDQYLESMTSAGAIVLSSGKPIKFIETDILNLKITFRRDFELYKRLGENYFYRNISR